MFFNYFCPNKSSVGSLTVKEGMPDECLRFCVRAASVLGALSHQLHNGQIPMRELQKVVRKKEQMKSLCQAAFMDGEQVEKGELPLKAVEQTLTSRMEEFEAFYQRQEYLVHLCDHIPDSVQGLFLCGCMYTHQQLCYLFFHSERIETTEARVGQRLQRL